jgi:hypothetical protein
MVQYITYKLFKINVTEDYIIDFISLMFVKNSDLC